MKAHKRIANGTVFGRLTVKAFAGFDGRMNQYLCVCECGNETTVNPYNLRDGKTKSCGCYKRDSSRARGLKRLSRVLSGDEIPTPQRHGEAVKSEEVPMSDHIEIFATYLRKTARAGGGVSGNRKALAMYLKMSVDQVCQARDALHASGRLVCEGQSYISIDGHRFGETANDTPSAPLMTYLRRRFSPVYDARTTDQPEKPHRGPPKELIIGNIRTSAAFAAALVLCAPGSRVSIV